MNEAHESCDGCRHDLGGGRDNCRLNLSYECRDGGGFEAWEADASCDQDYCEIDFNGRSSE